MSEPNIYQAPQTEVSEKHISGATLEHGYAEGLSLFIKKGFDSPSVCVISGEPVSPDTKRFRLLITYINPLAYLLIFIGLPGWVLIAVLQKNIRFHVYLSKENAQKFKRNKLIGIICWLLILPIFIAGMMLANVWLCIAGGVTFLFAAFWSIYTNKPLKLVNYEKQYFQLAKAHPNFLAQLPQSTTYATDISVFNNITSPKISTSAPQTHS